MLGNDCWNGNLKKMQDAAIKKVQMEVRKAETKAGKMLFYSHLRFALPLGYRFGL